MVFCIKNPIRQVLTLVSLCNAQWVCAVKTSVYQLITLVSLPMNFLERTFLDWKVTLDPIAARNPPQLKVASVTDAMATPPTMGNRDKTMGTVGVSPRKAADSATLKNGSSACRSQGLNSCHACASKDCKCLFGAVRNVMSYYVMTQITYPKPGEMLCQLFCNT